MQKRTWAIVLFAAALTGGELSTYPCDPTKCCCVSGADIIQSGDRLHLNVALTQSCACAMEQLNLACSLDGLSNSRCDGKVDGSPFHVERSGALLKLTTQCVDYSTLDVYPTVATLQCEGNQCSNGNEWGSRYAAYDSAGSACYCSSLPRSSCLRCGCRDDAHTSRCAIRSPCRRPKLGAIR